MARKANTEKIKEQVKAAADRAEAKAAKAEAKAAKQGAAPVEAALKPGPAPKSAAKNAAYSAEDQRLFNNYVPKVNDLFGRIASLNGELKALYRAAKADGFAKHRFDIARAVATAEGEAKIKGRIVDDLVTCKMVGSRLGDQLDMFLEPARVPAVDQAFEQGKLDAMQNKVARPSYDPSTEQYRRFMEGYHEEQARQLKAGIKETEPAAEQKVAELDRSAIRALRGPENAPSSGIGLTRADYQREMAKARAADEEAPASTDEDDESEAADEPSMFRRRL